MAPLAEPQTQLALIARAPFASNLHLLRLGLAVHTAQAESLLTPLLTRPVPVQAPWPLRHLAATLAATTALESLEMLGSIAATPGADDGLQLVLPASLTSIHDYRAELAPHLPPLPAGRRLRLHTLVVGNIARRAPVVIDTYAYCSALDCRVLYIGAVTPPAGPVVAPAVAAAAAATDWPRLESLTSQRTTVFDRAHVAPFFARMTNLRRLDIGTLNEISALTDPAAIGSRDLAQIDVACEQRGLRLEWREDCHPFTLLRRPQGTD